MPDAIKIVQNTRHDFDLYRVSGQQVMRPLRQKMNGSNKWAWRIEYCATGYLLKEMMHGAHFEGLGTFRLVELSLYPQQSQRIEFYTTHFSGARVSPRRRILTRTRTHILSTRRWARMQFLTEWAVILKAIVRRYLLRSRSTRK